jgi:hypothetical protein
MPIHQTLCAGVPLFQLQFKDTYIVLYIQNHGTIYNGRFYTHTRERKEGGVNKEIKNIPPPTKKRKIAITAFHLQFLLAPLFKQTRKTTPDLVPERFQICMLSKQHYNDTHVIRSSTHPLQIRRQAKITHLLTYAFQALSLL